MTEREIGRKSIGKAFIMKLNCGENVKIWRRKAILAATAGITAY